MQFKLIFEHQLLALVFCAAPGDPVPGHHRAALPADLMQGLRMMLRVLASRRVENCLASCLLMCCSRHCTGRCQIRRPNCCHHYNTGKCLDTGGSSRFRSCWAGSGSSSGPERVTGCHRRLCSITGKSQPSKLCLLSAPLFLYCVVLLAVS